MKRIMMMVATMLISGAIVSAQNRSADVSEVKFADTVVRLTVGPDTGGLESYPIREIFTFSNTKHVNLRLSVWIPGSDYAYKVFGINGNQASKSSMLKSMVNPSSDIVNSQLTINRPYLKTLRSSNQAMGFDAVKSMVANNQNGILRSSSSTSSAFRDPPFVFGPQSDSDLNFRIGLLNDNNALPIWTSDIQSVDPGTGNIAEFVWDGYSNRNGIRRLAQDQSAFYVLEDADTGAILHILYLATFAIDAYGNRTIDANGISENMAATRDMPVIAQYILTDWHCNFLPYDALNGGPQGMMEFLNGTDGTNGECVCGVLAYATTGNDAVDGVAAATQKTFDATIKADEVSSYTWTPVPGPNSNLKKLSAGTTYYILTVLWNQDSLNPNNYVVGQGTPIFYGFWDQKTLTQDMVLGAPTGIDNHAVEEVTVIWKGDTPYFEVNGQELKAEVYDLTGKKVQVVENSKFYIVQARTEDGKKYAQIVIR